MRRARKRSTRLHPFYSGMTGHFPLFVVPAFLPHSALPRRSQRPQQNLNLSRSPAISSAAPRSLRVQPATVADVAMPGRRPYGYWTAPENMRRELRSFAERHGCSGRMPSDGELVRGGRGDIASAVRRNGGWVAVALDAGLVLSSIARPRSIYLSYCVPLSPGARMKPNNFWREFENLQAELLKFLDEKFDESAGVGVVRGQMCLPSTREMEDLGRGDLVRAIRKHGGREVVAARLDLKFRFYSRGYWRNFENVEKEIRLLLDRFESADEMPPVVALERLGPPGLRNAVMVIHGGKMAVAKRMGLNVGHKVPGYWCLEENRIAETRRFLEATFPDEKPGILPSKRQMVKLGRADLAQGLERHAALQETAEALGLQYISREGKRHLNTGDDPKLRKPSLCRCLHASAASARA